MEDNLLDSVINNKYVLRKKIGSGKFGHIYLGANINKKVEVAIKLENSTSKYTTLRNEATILNYLYQHKCADVPHIYWYGKYLNYITLILPIYDCSLYDYMSYTHNVRDEHIYRLMVEALSIIENIHQLFVIHRDIKPQHFMIKNNRLYLIDFGISTFYVTDNKKLKPNVQRDDSVIGSPNYASFNLYNGHVYSRRDDLISLCYMFLFIYTLELPWEDLYSYNEGELYDNTSIHNSKNIQYKNMKELVQLMPICSKINTHLEIFLSYCYSLDYYDEPNYTKYMSLFHT